MIVGDGLIARELRAQGATRATYHAAGVSNSRCVDPAEYARDETRLRESLERPGPLVYFSTCSIYGEDTPYTAHKRRMEDLVLARGGTVLRLPNVVGHGAPAHQLVPYLYGRIVRGEMLMLQRGARRNLVDVDDVARMAKSLIYMGGITNIAASYDYTLAEIVAALEGATGRRAICEFVDGGVSHRIPESVLRTGPDYMREIISRHYADCIPARAAIA